MRPLIIQGPGAHLGLWSLSLQDLLKGSSWGLLFTSEGYWCRHSYFNIHTCWAYIITRPLGTLIYYFFLVILFIYYTGNVWLRLTVEMTMVRVGGVFMMDSHLFSSDWLTDRRKNTPFLHCLLRHEYVKQLLIWYKEEDKKKKKKKSTVIHYIQEMCLFSNHSHYIQEMCLFSYHSLFLSKLLFNYPLFNTYYFKYG